MKTINLNIIKTMGLLFSIVCLNSFLFSNNDNSLALIEGRILSKGTSIKGAMVNLTINDSIMYKTRAGMLGYYKIENIISGRYKLKVQAHGYMTETTNEIDIEPNDKLIKNISLKKKAIKHKKLASKELCAPMFLEEDIISEGLAIGKRSNNIYTYTQDDYLSSTESYSKINENEFFNTSTENTSTFSIDVDKASYSNIRRFLTYNLYPEADAVRVEEMINYFDYDYEEPKNKHPFAVHSTVAPSPWNKKTHLMKIGIKGKETFNNKNEDLPASNLVFLIDVSGSMSSANKLGLLKQSFSKLVDQLRQDDKVSIVVYAGAAGMVLPPTSGADKQKIKDALNSLSAGGSTAGGAGINLAYATAKNNFVKNGNNRVILATDGDFNIGVSSPAALETLITEKRKTGIYLTTIGLGMGNYKDDRMERLADKGNGNYFYIDNINEAKKVFVEEFTGTIYTIAKDVKIQVEFNDQYVKRYRLIGYENRKLANKDFSDDKKDAGELGMGHTVTAIYEVEFFNEPNNLDQSFSQVRLRYKKPDEDKSQLMTHNIKSFYKDLSSTDKDFKLACSVAAFGMKLRASKHLNGFSYDNILSLAKESKKEGDKYRDELISLIEKARILSPEFSSASK